MPLYGAGRRHPLRVSRPPRPGRRARALPDLRPTIASSGKDAPTGPATLLPKAVRPEEALVAPEDRSSALPAADPCGIGALAQAFRRAVQAFCRSPVLSLAERNIGKESESPEQ